MDIMDLLKNVPGLKDQLSGLGLDDNNISDMASGVKKQLAGDDGFDLTDLLTALDADSFLGKMDVGALAQQVGVSPEMVQGALALIAPKIAEFTGGGSALGGLGGFAKKLFGGK